MATAKLVKKYGGKVIVFGPNGVPRDTFNFAEHKAGIVDVLNEGAKAVVDLGLTPVLHQHTGTCIETREETYAVMQAVDTRYLKFGPDIGQLQKGGSDPVQVVKDFLPIIHHMHLKDYSGGDAFLGYSPARAGQGRHSRHSRDDERQADRRHGDGRARQQPEHADACARDGKNRARVSAEAGRDAEKLIRTLKEVS